MQNIKLIVLLGSVLFLFSACGPKYITKEEAYPKMYEYHPVSILVLPPINESTAADAKEYYSTTIAEPLTSSGYYIYPMEVTSDILKAEGIYDTELLLDTPPQKFKEFFGADAVLYIKILKWDTSYFVIGGNVTVSVEFLLRSTETGEDLWKYDGTIEVDTSGDSGGSAGLAGLLVNVLTTAIKTATTDYVPIAKRANTIALLSIPYGKYHPNYDKDKDSQVVIEEKIKSTPTTEK
jgi:hypothetical protein